MFDLNGNVDLVSRVAECVMTVEMFLGLFLHFPLDIGADSGNTLKRTVVKALKISLVLGKSSIEVFSSVSEMHCTGAVAAAVSNAEGLAFHL